VEKILALDLSTKSTGYTIFDSKGSILAYGVLKPTPYPGYTLDRYPSKSVRFCMDLAEQIYELVCQNCFTKILIEEVNPGKGSMLGTKTLCGLHFIILAKLEFYLPKIEFITTSKWRGNLGIKKNNDWKLSTIEFVNRTYGTEFTFKDNDITDSIAMGASYFKDLGLLNIPKIPEKTKKKSKKLTNPK
jgi:hypothetical protein